MCDELTTRARAWCRRGMVPTPAAPAAREISAGTSRKVPRWYKNKRQRNATKGQKRTLRRLSTVYALESPDYGVQLPRIDAVWGLPLSRSAVYDVLDIGFGRGESVLEALRGKPVANASFAAAAASTSAMRTAGSASGSKTVRVLAIDNFKPGIAALYSGLEAMGAGGDRAKVWCGDAAKLIHRHWPTLQPAAAVDASSEFCNASYAGFNEAHFICPDPWETRYGRAKLDDRARYHAQLRDAQVEQRAASSSAELRDSPCALPPPDRAFAAEGEEQRILRPATLRLLEQRILRPDGGLLRLVTDVPTLAAATRLLLATEGDGQWRELGKNEVKASWRRRSGVAREGPPETTYLLKAKAEGRVVVDLAWERIPPPLPLPLRIIMK